MSNSIALFGKVTSRYLYCKSLLQSYLDVFGYDTKIEEISTIAEMIDRNIDSIPSLCIENDCVSIYKKEQIEDFVLRCICLILQRIENPNLVVLKLSYDSSTQGLEQLNGLKDMIFQKTVALQLILPLEKPIENQICFKHTERISPTFTGNLTKMSSYIPVLHTIGNAHCVLPGNVVTLDLCQENWKQKLHDLNITEKSLLH